MLMLMTPVSPTSVAAIKRGLIQNVSVKGTGIAPVLQVNAGVIDHFISSHVLVLTFVWCAYFVK